MDSSRSDGELTFSEADLETEPMNTKVSLNYIVFIYIQVYYFIDGQSTAYTTTVPVPPSKITLENFKRFFGQTNYKFYSKVMDSILKE